VIGRQGRPVLVYREDAYSSEVDMIEEALADAEDLVELRAAKKEEHDVPGAPLEEVVDELGLSG
jgi:hypothetical protein